MVSLFFGLVWSVVPAVAAPPEVADVLRAELSVRHDPPACDALGGGASAEAVRDGLVAIAEGDEAPPWLPMRAAHCVVLGAGADPVALDAARRWLRDDASPGLGLVVVKTLDDLPVAVAGELAEAALRRSERDPRFARYARPSLASSAHATVAERARAADSRR